MILCVHNIPDLEEVITHGALKQHLPILRPNFDGDQSRADQHATMPLCCNACFRKGLADF